MPDEDRPAGTEGISAFYDLGAAASSLAASGFTIGEEISTLVDLFRGPDPKVSLGAHKQLSSRIREIATVNGLIGTATASQEHTEDGTTQRRTLTTARLLATRNRPAVPRLAPDIIPAIPLGPSPEPPSDL